MSRASKSGSPDIEAITRASVASAARHENRRTTQPVGAIQMRPWQIAPHDLLHLRIGNGAGRAGRERPHIGQGRLRQRCQLAPPGTRSVPPAAT
jgi:hypothetical protein